MADGKNREQLYRYEFIETPIAHIARTHKMIEGAGGLQAYINRPRDKKRKDGYITLEAVRRLMRRMESATKTKGTYIDTRGNKFVCELKGEVSRWLEPSMLEGILNAEPLDPEFAKVWEDNIDELYEE